MTKIDIFSGFLGAGKTTLIKKLISEAYSGEKLVLIENEFGDIGIDGGFLQDAGINITEMNSGCICCSLVGDFGKALRRVIVEYSPDRILIEPSGVGKLSDVIRAVQDIELPDIVLNVAVTIADVNKCKMYMKNFGEFFNNQIEHASVVILSHTTDVSDKKLAECVEKIREYNTEADILTTPWEQLTGKQILEFLEKTNTLENELEMLKKETECPVCHHHHADHEHHHEHGEHCGCGHDHEHHHEHGEHCDCGHDHEHHHHEHGEHCDCGHDHEHNHHADEVFTSFGAQTGRRYTLDEIKNALSALADEHKYGVILRAKGIVDSAEGFIHFDYVPGEADIRFGSAIPTGRLCVIGADINEAAIKELFML